MRLAVVILAIAAVTAGPASAGFLIAPAGYASYETPDISLSGFVASFDTYQDKYVLFSGRDVQIVNSSGAVERTVHSFGTDEYPDSFYGSFVKVVGDSVYIGESSNGTIRKASLTGDANLSTITTVTNNYDIAFDASGRMFIIGASAGWKFAEIWMVGEDGSKTLVTSFEGASGPITFDGSGNLYCAPFDYLGSTSYYKWTAAQLEGAITGGTTLSTSDAAVIASDAYNPSAFATDNDGNLYFTSWSVVPGTIWKLSAVDQSISEFAKVSSDYSYSGLTGLRFNSVTGAFSTLGSLTKTVMVWDDEFQDYIPQNTYHTRIGILQPVPEPSSLIALGSMVGLAFAMRRRRR